MIKRILKGLLASIIIFLIILIVTTSINVMFHFFPVISWICLSAMIFWIGYNFANN